jgi:protein SCO1/2
MLGLLSSMCTPSAAASTLAPEVRAMVHGEAPPPGLGGPLNLVMHTGKPFTLAQVKGTPTLLFFGFTQCANTCPVAMAQARQVLEAFRAGKPPHIVFVTLDPLSDPPQVLADYLARFDKRIIGLTGSPTQIEAAARRYGVGVQNKRAGPLEHSSRWYLLDEDAQLQRVYKLDTPASAMVQDIARSHAQRLASTWREGAP